MAGFWQVRRGSLQHELAFHIVSRTEIIALHDVTEYMIVTDHIYLRGGSMESGDALLQDGQATSVEALYELFSGENAAGGQIYPVNLNFTYQGMSRQQPIQFPHPVAAPSSGDVVVFSFNDFGTMIPGVNIPGNIIEINVVAVVDYQ